MRSHLPLLAFIFCPSVTVAQDIPVYDRSGNDLFYYGETVSEAVAVEVLGGQELYRKFGRPRFIVRHRDGTNQASYEHTPEQVELVLGGDGVVDGQPDDLVFTEEEALDTRDDLTFGEDEGLDARDDLTFGENEGTRVDGDLIFDAPDATQPRDDLVFEETDAIPPAKSLSTQKPATQKPAPPKAESLATIEREGGPVDLFRSDKAQTILPLDGKWSVTIQEAFATGCPPGIAEQARAQLLRSKDMTVTFSKPNWHPADLSAEFAGYDWRKIGRNGFFAYPYATGAEAEGSGMSLAVSLAYLARKPTLIDMWYRVRVNLTPFLAQIAGSSESCEAVIFAELFKE